MTTTIRVTSPEVGYLNVRAQPEGAILTTLPHHSVVTPVEPEAAALAKVGVQGQWLRIRLSDGREAYIASWYLAAEGGPPVSGAGIPVWVYSPDMGILNIRSAGSTNAQIVTKVEHNAMLTALEDAAAVQAKLGQDQQWLRVQVPGGPAGYAAAWYLASSPLPPPDPALAPPEAEKIPLANLPEKQLQLARVWNRLGGRLQALAGELGFDPGLAVAIWLVESGGRAFGPGGRLIIRFENHQFYAHWGHKAPAVFQQHFKFNNEPKKNWHDHEWRPSPHADWRKLPHTNQDDEWEVFTFARTLDETAAMLSISMGGPQIMGFNYKMLGYSSVQAMFEAFAAGEGAHVQGFFDFVRKSRPGTVPCLKNADFEGFALIYNGPGQAEKYGNLIRQAYEAFRPLRAGARGGVLLEAKAIAAPTMRESDDFRRILGIGPKTVTLLHAAGIHTFTELAALDEVRLTALLGEAAKRLRWIPTWPVQARLASWGDWEALRAYQVEIRG